MFEQAQGRLDSRTAMIKGIVHDQDHRAVGVTVQQQVFEEGDEGLAVLDRDDLMAKPIDSPVQRAYDMVKGLGAAGSWQTTLPSALHPALAQRRLQVHRALSTKRRTKSPCSAFFNSTRRASASARAPGS